MVSRGRFAVKEVDANELGEYAEGIAYRECVGLHRRDGGVGYGV